MFEGDGATQAKETEDLFPVRDTETHSRELVTSRLIVPKTSSKLARDNSQEVVNFCNEKSSLNFEEMTVSQLGEEIFRISHIWYRKTCSEATKAIHDVKNTWTVTSGKSSEKMKVTSRLVMYYLIILSLYIIKSCFWVDRKLLAGLHKMLLRSKKNTQMLIGLGIVLSLIVVVYVIGAPCPEPQAVCDK